MKITILLIVLLIVLLLFTTNIGVIKRIVNLKINKTDTLKKHLEVEDNCPRLNGSYKQCTDTGTYRHSLDGIKQNHLVYKNNPRVNIWNTTK
tara:strand:- start:146 stop:421 length:276 start_codon:yes stop_codon:yes gene_type:complete